MYKISNTNKIRLRIWKLWFRIFLLWPFSNLNHSSERVYGLKITVQNASQSTQVFTYYKWNKNVLMKAESERVNVTPDKFNSTQGKETLNGLLVCRLLLIRSSFILADSHCLNLHVVLYVLLVGRFEFIKFACGRATFGQ